MSIEIKIKGMDLVKRYIKTAPRKAISAINDELYDSAIDYRSAILKKMKATPRRPDRSYRRGRKQHYPSMPGSPPAIDRGELISAMFVDKKRNGAVFHVDKEYANYLEKGTSRMAARPVYEKTINEMETTIFRNVKRAVKRAMTK